MPDVNAEKLGAEFTKTLEALAAAVSKQDAEIKTLGSAKDKTGIEVDRLDKQVVEMQGLLTHLKKHADEQLAQTQRMAQDADGSERKSLVQILHGDKGFQEALKRGAKSCDPVQIPGGLRPYMEAVCGPSLVKQLTTAAGSMGAMIRPDRVPGMQALPNVPAVRVGQLLPRRRATTGAIEFVRRLAPVEAIRTLFVSAVGAVVTVENAQGFRAGQVVTFRSPDGAPANYNRTILSVDLDANTITLTLAPDVATVADDIISGTRFVGTTETNLKPEGGLRSELLTVNTRTIAHGFPASRQILADVDGMQGLIETEGMEGLLASEEQQLLYGTGVDPQIFGFLVDPDVQGYAWSSGAIGDTKVDALRRAATLVGLLNSRADGAIVHDNDWEDLELTKGSDGHYIWVNVQTGGTTQMWRLPIAVTSSINEGDFAVGNFRRATAIRDQEDATMRFSEHHNDFFMRNMLMFLFEERLAQTIFLPQLIVAGGFDAAPGP